MSISIENYYYSQDLNPASRYTEWIQQKPVNVFDNDGNVIICYNTNVALPTFTKTGSWDIVVTKLTSDGTILWTKEDNDINTIGDNNIDPDQGVPTSVGIDIDSSNNIYIISRTNTQFSNTTNYGGTDMVIIKLNSSGVLQWRVQPEALNTSNNEGVQTVPSISVDNSTGHVYVSYTTYGTITGGTQVGAVDVVYAKLSMSDGSVIWAKQTSTLNTADYDIYSCIKADNTGNIYLSYITNGTVTGETSVGGYDLVLVKLNTNGDVVWIQKDAPFDTQNDEYDRSFITFDRFNNIYVAYSTYGVIPDPTQSGGRQLPAVAKFSPSGTLLWTRQFFPGESNPSWAVGINYDNDYIYASYLYRQPNNKYVVYISQLDINTGAVNFTYTDISNFFTYTDDSDPEYPFTVYDEVFALSMSTQKRKMFVTVSCSQFYYADGGNERLYTNRGIYNIKLNLPPTSAPNIYIRPRVNDQSITYTFFPSWTYPVSSLALVLRPDGEPSVTQTFTPNTTTFTFTGLTYNKYYFTNVYSIDNDRISSAAAEYRTVTPGAKPPVVQNLTAQKTNNSLLISWNPPIPSSNYTIKGYSIRSSNAIPELKFNVPAHSTAFLTPSLNSGNIAFSVQAVNDTGYGPKTYTNEFII